MDEAMRRAQHDMSAPPHGHGAYERLLAACQAQPPVRMAIVHPCSDEAVEAAIEARDRGLIVPVFVGPAARITASAAAAGVDISGIELVSTPHSHASAETAVAMIRAGR